MRKVDFRAGERVMKGVCEGKRIVLFDRGGCGWGVEDVCRGGKGLQPRDLMLKG